MMAIAVLAGTASGIPPPGRLEFNRIKRDANDTTLDKFTISHT